MSPGTVCFRCLVLLCIAVIAAPVLADSAGSPAQKVIYQTPFSSDPHWETNSPTYDYWDPATGRYHFSIQPSTNNRADMTIDNMEGSFDFEYDVTFERVDDGAAFRFGLTGAEMDFNKGPNVITMFSNGKYDNLMSLHLVTVGAKELEVNSQNDDELTSGPIAYKGPTVHYALNKTYHVSVQYDDDSTTTTMRVSDKATGQEIWSYFIKTVENMKGMNHIYLGSRGDYGAMYATATGYIDNVRLTQPAPDESPVAVSTSTVVPLLQTPSPTQTTRKQVVLHTPEPAPSPTDTPESPAGVVTVLTALCLMGGAYSVFRGKRF